MNNVALIEMDIRDEHSVQHGIEKLIFTAGRIDVLVNSAGVSMIGAVEETSVEEAARLFSGHYVRQKQYYRKCEARKADV